MLLSALAVGEETGGLDDQLHVEIAPGKCRRIPLGQDLQLVPSRPDDAFADLDVLAQLTENRVVLQEMTHRLRVAEIVERDDLEIAAPLQMRPEEIAPDPSEPVDSHPCLGHGSSLNDALQRRGDAHEENRLNKAMSFSPLVFSAVSFRHTQGSGGSALVRRRIQTPSDATVLSVVQPEGEVVLGASPPARLPARSPVRPAVTPRLLIIAQRLSKIGRRARIGGGVATRVGINGFGRIGRNFY